MMSKIYRLFCEICSWKRITDGKDLDDLTTIKRSKIQRGIPKIDPKTKKIMEPKWKTLPKKFKCPNCGRPARATQISNPQKQLKERIEQEKAIKEKTEAKSLMIKEMKDRYKDRREKEILQANKDAETRSLARELEEKRLKEELNKIELQNNKLKDAEDENRNDGS